jgi:hypothetical protein
MDIGLGSDNKPWGYRQADLRHGTETGSFPSQKLLIVAIPFLEGKTISPTWHDALLLIWFIFFWAWVLGSCRRPGQSFNLTIYLDEQARRGGLPSLAAEEFHLYLISLIWRKYQRENANFFQVLSRCEIMGLGGQGSRFQVQSSLQFRVSTFWVKNFLPGGKCGTAALGCFGGLTPQKSVGRASVPANNTVFGFRLKRPGLSAS